MIILFPVLAAIVLLVLCLPVYKKARLKTIWFFLWVYCWNVNNIRILELNLHWLHDRHTPVGFVSRQLVMLLFPLWFVLYLYLWEKAKNITARIVAVILYLLVLPVYLHALYMSRIIYTSDWKWWYGFIFAMISLLILHAGKFVYTRWLQKGAYKNAS
ncbi:hypothetical protein [Heyndrickxia acidiproducens]|uniref:hypothetical protein n=1 Tax=Heyndrickxia acidiproducens TaxID=1121084 RepID=UPI0003764A9B|nr:hypothetical protein [Heyndrickxia acidiproducens]